MTSTVIALAIVFLSGSTGLTLGAFLGSALRSRTIG